jgi:lipopolysaccharide/colanic/teichoic acid biosynthesis glycosyltransferase
MKKIIKNPVLPENNFMNLYRLYIKRFLDLILAFLGIVLCAPLLILITVLLYFYNSGLPYFIQERPGKDGQIFSIIKFKTMKDAVDNRGHVLPDNQRLTLIGKYLRLTSLDELPQLVNILKGEMSFVGPRPLLIEYLPLYNDLQKRRHEVLPGLTGWAQINGRNAITWEEKFALDVWYVDNISLFIDIKIFWLSILKVIKREGIGLDGSKLGSVTLEPFRGNKK